MLNLTQFHPKVVTRPMKDRGVTTVELLMIIFIVAGLILAIAVIFGDKVLPAMRSAVEAVTGYKPK